MQDPCQRQLRPRTLAAMRSNSIIDGLGIHVPLAAAPQSLADSVPVLVPGPSFPPSTDSRPTLSSRKLRDPGVHLHAIACCRSGEINESEEKTPPVLALVSPHHIPLLPSCDF